MNWKAGNKWLTVMLVGLVMGCGAETESDDGVPDRDVNEWGQPTFSVSDNSEVAPGKDDAISGQRGLPTSVDNLATSVWDVRNAWEDTDTAAARQAGPAWGEDSGLSWDEKYQRWVDSLERIDSVGGYSTYDTFMLKTPWGKQVPAPTLECAEVAIFLRITFASWYNLPFFMEARDAEGRVYFGHFGMRRDNGKFGSMPNFRDRYSDFSDRADSVRDGGEWPSDSRLRELTIPGSFDDEQPQLGDGLHAGAYFDEIYLNKRVGYFMRLTLAWFGSINLADPVNTFNLAPASIRPGDVLVERWQQQGIGHTLIVMEADEVGTTDVNGATVPQFEVEVASGSMPRRQPKWESSGASKRYFSLDATGGEGKESYGGGLKRWRITKEISGRWTNVVPAEYAAAWVNSTDHDAISGRLDTFRDILVELSPEQKRSVILELIESKRLHLQNYPASCAARIAREEAFDSLYELMADEYGMSADDVDAEYRRMADYVFAELEYDKSKTCCWNRSTPQMYEIVMDLNATAQADAEMCVAPIVFMNRDDGTDGFELFRQHAVELGRGDEWVEWSADESCPWEDIPEATVAEVDHTTYCELPGGGQPEPDEPVVTGDRVTATFGAGDIPDNDTGGLVVSSTVEAAGEITSAVVDVDISHTWRGDLEIVLVHPDGTELTLKTADGSSDADVNEQYEAAGLIGKSAAGEYQLIIRDTAEVDTGTLNEASITLGVQG